MVDDEIHIISSTTKDIIVGGRYVEFMDDNKLIDTEPLVRKKYGDEGRKYFIKNFEMEKKSRDLISIINSRIGL